MKRVAVAVLLLAVVGVAACGDDEEVTAPAPSVERWIGSAKDAGSTTTATLVLSTSGAMTLTIHVVAQGPVDPYLGTFEFRGRWTRTPDGMELSITEGTQDGIGLDSYSAEKPGLIPLALSGDGGNLDVAPLDTSAFDEPGAVGEPKSDPFHLAVVLTQAAGGLSPQDGQSR